ncbi:MAG TPA: cation:proton antiporter [Blastocatellia bacterium]|nr:cation:proton antiporter [Blastocatellia bacterium]
MNKNLLLYIASLVIIGAGILFLFELGSRLNKAAALPVNQAEIAPRSPAPAQAGESATVLTQIGKALRENLRSSLSLLLLQIIVIIIVARLFGSLFLKVGQPAVIGEMVAGILLGPSLLGMVSPATLSFLFPEPALATLQALSQIGVILFMFTVGMEFHAQHLREKAQAVFIISQASIIIPFFLGVTLALVMYRPFAPPNVSFMAFALFIGIAMSITAFPVLARIVEERRLSKTYIGTTAIACAAVADVSAWCLLALVVAISKAEGLSASLLPIALSLLFIAAMIFVIKPPLERIISRRVEDVKRSKALVAGVVAFVFACAWFTEIIGVHALFGGFLAGVVMPAVAGFRPFLKERLETFSSAVLLPLFFALTGLRTQVTLLNDWQSWLTGAGVIAVAIVGKLGGSMLAARWAGMRWRESFSIGALMNTRGLVELIVLNIGYELGILDGRIFAIMVLMALVTTCMTGPLLSLAQAEKEAEATQAVSPAGRVES